MIEGINIFLRNFLMMFGVFSMMYFLCKAFMEYKKKKQREY